MTRVKFESIPIEDNAESLVNLAEYPFLLETVYRDRGVSDLATHYVREGVAKKLLIIQENFGGEYQLKIWDGWRPRHVQNALYQEFWQQLKREHPSWSDEQIHNNTEQFVTMATNLERIPPHATGGTLDLTLVDKHGTELNMGTVFDHFGPEAAPEYFDHHKEIAANRRLLQEAMKSQGFTPDEDEWWHFDYGCQLWAVRLGEPVAIYGEATLRCDD
jgi:D-alanyl-D-alanine dipeptidase